VEFKVLKLRGRHGNDRSARLSRFKWRRRC
jgi:hypothetical protein